MPVNIHRTIICVVNSGIFLLDFQARYLVNYDLRVLQHQKQNTFLFKTEIFTN